MKNLQPHIKIHKNKISSFVLLPGDPGRVEVIGKRLKNFKIQYTNREFKIGTGQYKNIPITVCSTGIGGPSTAIAVEELIDAGAKILIRVGTCGGAWRKNIPLGSLIIPTASIRDEGTTREYIQEGFPAVADFEIVQALRNSAINNKKNFVIGINRTHDAFYGSQDSIIKWGLYLQDRRWKNYETPILSSEMESAPLFVIASLRGVKAGAILAVNGNPEALKDRLMRKSQKIITEADAKKSVKVINDMVLVALEAIIELANHYHS